MPGQHGHDARVRVAKEHNREAEYALDLCVVENA